jgi:predicted lipoprotein with Yx(FWY)xxD motif
MNAAKTFFVSLALGFACNAASAQAIAERNGVLTSQGGRTLYTFDRDAGGKSTCNGGCATAWPPYIAQDGASASGRVSIVTRYDGSKQWAIDGKPLYFFAGDLMPGDAKGDGHSGLWHVAQHAAKRGKTATAARLAIDPYTSYFRQVFSRDAR